MSQNIINVKNICVFFHEKMEPSTSKNRILILKIDLQIQFINYV